MLSPYWQYIGVEAALSTGHGALFGGPNQFYSLWNGFRCARNSRDNDVLRNGFIDQQVMVMTAKKKRKKGPGSVGMVPFLPILPLKSGHDFFHQPRFITGKTSNTIPVNSHQFPSIYHRIYFFEFYQKGQCP